MYSVYDNVLMHTGFSHSEISGSKVVYHLPEAYRKLLRPSSPLAAKASTVCTSLLDHITSINLMIFSSISIYYVFLKKHKTPNYFAVNQQKYLNLC